MPQTLSRPKPRDEQLVALTISNGGVDSDKLPTRLKLLNWGDNSTIKGNVRVGKATLATLAANQEARGFDRIALDFNHNTVPGSDTFQPDPAPVAAYGTPVVIEGDGLYLEDIKWTPKGREMAANYHDLSPTVQQDKQGEVIFLHSAALCRQGAVNGLQFFSVPLQPLNTTPMPDTTAATSSNSAVDYKGLLVSILQKLGVSIPDGASDSDLATAVDQFKAPTPAVKPADKPAAGAAAVTPMSAEARLDRIEKNSLVALAASQGKVVPLSAAEIDAVPYSVLQSIVDRTQPTVPLAAKTVPGTLASAAAGATASPVLRALSAEEKVIATNMGVSEEAFAKELIKTGGSQALTVV